MTFMSINENSFLGCQHFKCSHVWAVSKPIFWEKKGSSVELGSKASFTHLHKSIEVMFGRPFSCLRHVHWELGCYCTRTESHRRIGDRSRQCLECADETNKALENDGTYGVPPSGQIIKWFNRERVSRSYITARDRYPTQKRVVVVFLSALPKSLHSPLSQVLVCLIF